MRCKTPTDARPFGVSRALLQSMGKWSFQTPCHVTHGGKRAQAPQPSEHTTFSLSKSCMIPQPNHCPVGSHDVSTSADEERKWCTLNVKYPEERPEPRPHTACMYLQVVSGNRTALLSSTTTAGRDSGRRAPCHIIPRQHPRISMPAFPWPSHLARRQPPPSSPPHLPTATTTHHRAQSTHDA